MEAFRPSLVTLQVSSMPIGSATASLERFLHSWGINLVNLQLYFNKLTGMLPVELAQLQNLVNFHVFSNSLHGEIPPELGGLKSLVALYLGTNNFSGNIPSTFSKLHNLQYLEMSVNRLSGEIPSFLGVLSNLLYIDLSNNAFSGGLPSSLANCTKLQWLKLGNNLLSGSIPDHYGSFRMLHTFSLGMNKLTGNLLRSFANYSSLVVLDLRQNNLTGGLPDGWAQAENLRVLSLANNKLGGPLPSWLWSLHQVQLLDLSKNNFSGSISREVGHMNGLKAKADTTQDNMTLWQDSAYLDVGGRESYYKYVLQIVTAVDLSDNSLHGYIPEELGFLNGLVHLDLSTNTITGTIPSSLGDIYSLQTLDLSKNSLTGSIPLHLADLTSLAFLNLSSNNLSGMIPRGPQFNTFSSSSYLNNVGLCGFPLSVSCSDVSKGPNSSPPDSGRSSNSKLIAGCISGVVIGMIITGLVCFVSIKKLLTEKPKVQIFVKRIKLSAREISRATNGFSDDHVVGHGGFSTVYKAKLRDGTVVAIKKLKMANQLEQEKRLVSECTTLSKIRHRNLVKVLASYTSRDVKALVLEYIPNGTLDMHLYEEPCNLDWSMCFNIALGVAQGLVYLHDETGFGQILHCDLKPSNILSDADYEPHICDFGIAKMIASNVDSALVSSIIKGSIGHMAPEYAYGERMTEKVDVYSYGVILLEMLVRKRPTSEMFEEGKSLPKWVEQKFVENWTEVIDTAYLKEAAEATQKELHALLSLGLWCVKENPKDRPKLREALDVLLLLKEKVPNRKVIEISTEGGTSTDPLLQNAYFSASSSAFSSHPGTSSDFSWNH